MANPFRSSSDGRRGGMPVDFGKDVPIARNSVKKERPQLKKNQ